MWIAQTLTVTEIFKRAAISCWGKCSRRLSKNTSRHFSGSLAAALFIRSRISLRSRTSSGGDRRDMGFTHDSLKVPKVNLLCTVNVINLVFQGGFQPGFQITLQFHAIAPDEKIYKNLLHYFFRRLPGFQPLIGCVQQNLPVTEVFSEKAARSSYDLTRSSRISSE